MDYFDSNFNDDKSQQQEGLPADFAWEDMKDGIYEKMGTGNATNNKKYWGLFLLLLISGCGGWMAMDYFNKSEPSTEQEIIAETNIEIKESEDKTVLKEELYGEKGGNTNQGSNQKISETSFSPEANNELETTSSKTKSPAHSNQATLNDTKSNPEKQSQTQLPRSTTTINSSAAEIITSGAALNPQKEASQSFIIADDSNLLSREETLISKTKLRSDFKITASLLQPISFLASIHPFANNFYPNKMSTSKSKRKNLEQFLAFGFATGVNNWIAIGAENISNDFISGFPGYTINPFLSVNIKDNQSLQLDYEYSFLQELFEYRGEHGIRVPVEDVVVKEVHNSLTGQVISQDREDLVLNGVRSYQEVKYNKYKLQNLSLGYRYGLNGAVSNLGIYIGATYLFKLNAEGKRLNEELDVIAFNDADPIFRKNQFGLKLGLTYDYKIGERSTIFAQLMATQYLTNWELTNSNSNTRPFLYGLQLGLRQRLKK